jgi:hypothetical protein
VELLGRGGFRVGVAAGPQRGHEQLDGDLLSRPGVDQVRLLTGEVDEGLLTRSVMLAHRGLELARPAAVDLAELAVPVTVRMDLAVLLPQEVEGDASPRTGLQETPAHGTILEA